MTHGSLPNLSVEQIYYLRHRNAILKKRRAHYRKNKKEILQRLRLKRAGIQPLDK